PRLLRKDLFRLRQELAGRRAILRENVALHDELHRGEGRGKRGQLYADGSMLRFADDELTFRRDLIALDGNLGAMERLDNRGVRGDGSKLRIVDGCAIRLFGTPSVQLKVVPGTPSGQIGSPPGTPSGQIGSPMGSKVAHYMPIPCVSDVVGYPPP